MNDQDIVEYARESDLRNDPLVNDLVREVERLRAVVAKRGQARALADEAWAIRDAYLEFWGAHSSADFERIGIRPAFPATPNLDQWHPRDESAPLMPDAA